MKRTCERGGTGSQRDGLNATRRLLYRGDSLLFVHGPQANQTEACCKVCRTGKACGDTCVSRDKRCYVEPEYACGG